VDWLDKLTIAQFLDHPKVPVSAKNRVAKAGSVALKARLGQKSNLAKVERHDYPMQAQMRKEIARLKWNRWRPGWQVVE